MRQTDIGLCWGTLQGAGFPELIDAASRYGFPTLSVTPPMVLDTLEREPAMARRLEDAGVRVQVIDAIGGDLPGSVAESAGAATCFRAAEAVGAPIVNICHYRFEGDPPGLPEMTDAVGAITRDAASRGLRVVLEFVPDSGIPDLAFAMAIVRGVDHASCGVLVDPWHLARSGGTVDDVVGLPAGSIGAFQLDDWIEPPPGTPYVPMTGRELPGEGALPLRELARAVLANNPKVTVEIEVFSEELRTLTFHDAAKRVRAAVDAWLEGFDEH